MQNELDLRDPDRIVRRYKALKVSQPIGDIFVASVDFASIGKMTRFDVRRRLKVERDIEKYLGIQRPLNEVRVTELNKYVNFIDATFPTSVIVAIEPGYATYDSDASEIVLSNCREYEDVPSINFSNIGRVIDGQHRIAGLDEFRSESGRKFDVIVSFFLESDISDQAYVFATVNLEQTKVNKSLAYDLFELARSRSPLKTCHNIAVALDQTPNSPFFHKIKRLGVATDGRNEPETLTQATFVNSLLRYISLDPKADRDAILRGHKLPPPSAKELEALVFRGLFISGDDIKIGKIYEEYFSAIAERWPLAWQYRGTGNMLARTNGYRALASVFGRAYRQIAAPGDFVGRGAFGRLFARVDFEWDHFDTQNYRPGSSGEAELRNDLLRKLNLA
tara:strand:+ start:1480 stop:2655 length:1176 start_codon:yes stop_codon:yes gene_type:complete